MAEASISVDHHQFSCPVCLDLLKDPVTISCGHSYCMKCINDHWDQEDQWRIYSCPQCREKFNPRPVLRKNNILAEVVEKLKKKKVKPASSSAAGSEDVECDFCTGTKLKAIKFCLMCLSSFCEAHLKPHYEVPGLKKHKLVDASTQPQEKICSQHDKPLEIYCCTDQTCICYMCAMEGHKGHITVSAATERTEKQSQFNLMKRRFQQRIQEKQKKLQELKQTVITVKSSAQSAVEDSEKIFTDIIRSIEKKCSEVIKQIRDQEKTELSQAEELVEKLEQQIADLKRRNNELEQLRHTEDHIYFLQSFQSLCVSSESEDSSSITVRQHPSFDEVMKSVSELKERLEELCTGAPASDIEFSGYSYGGGYSRSALPTSHHLPRTDVFNRGAPARERDSYGYSYGGGYSRSALSTSHHLPRTDVFNRDEQILSTETVNREEFLQYFRQMTLDPNTVNSKLILSDNNRVVMYSEKKQRYPDHPERFERFTQVLCKESVSGRCYWEVEWSHGGFSVEISVSYNEISRKGSGYKPWFGRNSQSWSLKCDSSYFCFYHNNINTIISAPVSSRIGVYVDHSAGTLSFYSISDTMTLLHTINTTFTQPLYAGFWVDSVGAFGGGTVRLCDK